MDNLFHIFKISIKEAKKNSESPDDVHNHDFEELIVGIEGELEHFIDFKTERFISPFISFITKGKPYRVKPCADNKKFDIWVIEFLGIWDVDKLAIKAVSEAEFLLMEVPME
jgi:hypothetical protein